MNIFLNKFFIKANKDLNLNFITFYKNTFIKNDNNNFFKINNIIIN